MHVQDLIFAVGNLVFIVALIPATRGRDKPPVSTSAMTASVLFIFAATYVSLELWYAAATTAVTALLWSTLAIQKFAFDRQTKLTQQTPEQS